MNTTYDANLRRILFVIAGQFEVIGGHLLSAASLARCLVERGHEVGFLVTPVTHRIPELEDLRVRFHFDQYPTGTRAYVSSPYLSRPQAICDVSLQYKYDVLVAMDWPSAIHAGMAAVRCGIPVVQVRAGGRVGMRPPLRIPGIVVFSQELLDGFVQRFSVPHDNIFLSEGRVDFNGLLSQPNCPRILLFDQSGLSRRVLLVSRLNSQDKMQAVVNLLEEVERAAQQYPIELVIVGGGEYLQRIAEHANKIVVRTHGQAQAKCIGNIRVALADIRQADLVVGQGRTVLEALGCGVAAAVCGQEGYFGLVRPENLAALARSNMTGRNVGARSNLACDLAALEMHRLHEFKKVRDIVLSKYDAARGAEAIEKALALFVERYPTVASRRMCIGRAVFLDALGWACHYGKKEVCRCATHMADSIHGLNR